MHVSYLPQIVATLAGGTQKRTFDLQPDATAGMLVQSLTSAYGRVILGITVKNVLLKDPTALLRDICEKASSLKVQVRRFRWLFYF